MAPHGSAKGSLGEGDVGTQATTCGEANGLRPGLAPASPEFEAVLADLARAPTRLGASEP